MRDGMIYTVAGILIGFALGAAGHAQSDKSTPIVCHAGGAERDEQPGEHPAWRLHCENGYYVVVVD